MHPEKVGVNQKTYIRNHISNTSKAFAQNNAAKQ